MLLISCVSKKNIGDETPKLVFLNYIISKTSKNNISVQFISKTKTDGKLKNASNIYTKSGSVNDLKCSQLDKDSSEIESIIIKNPFIKQIEMLSDSLIFENKTVEIRQTPLILRLQLHNKTKFIAISEIIDTLQHTSPLHITKID